MEISTVSVNCVDRAIIVNGIGYFCEFTPAPGTQAIQWDGSIGHIVGAKGVQTPFLQPDFDNLLGLYVKLWKQARAKHLRANCDEMKRQSENNEQMVETMTVSQGHLRDHVAELDATISENPTDERAKNLRVVAGNDLDRVTRSIETHKAAVAAIAEKLLVQNELATQAERDVA